MSRKEKTLSSDDVTCYGIEVCPANKSDIRSLQYVVGNCFRKIFDIKLKETVEEYV